MTKTFTIPKSVKIGGMQYSVDDSEVVVIDGNANFAGRIDYTDLNIVLLDTLAQQRKEEAFVHEMLHGCFFEAGYPEHDEEIIERVSKVLYQVLQDNEFLIEMPDEKEICTCEECNG